MNNDWKEIKGTIEEMEGEPAEGEQLFQEGEQRLPKVIVKPK